MYEGWRIRRWDTPVVEEDQLLMVSLVDVDRELVLLFESGRDSGRLRWRVRFRQYPAYRNVDEAYRTELWRWLDTSGQRVGFTFTVEESPPLASWGTVYLHEVMPGIRHFVIATGDDVVEVLSAEEPVWEALGPAMADEPRGGNATHLDVHEDDAEIERPVEDSKRRQRPGPTG